MAVSLTTPAWAVWVHLWRTQLVELLLTTVGLLVGVEVGVLVLGTGLAWLVTAYDFPGRRVFEWALVLPLALPAYVIGFVFLGVFDYAGPLQTALRAWLGAGLRLPDPRASWGVAVVMTFVFYPYVYALARTAFRDQAPEAIESARALGRTRWGVLRHVTLPLARPALVAGMTLAGMEALADFGTVATFGVRTLTVAVYRVWHGLFDRPAATQLAALLLTVAVTLVVVERTARGRARFAQPRRRGRAAAPTRLSGVRAWAASGTCLTVLTVAFGLPVAQLGIWVGEVLARDGLPAGFGGLVAGSLQLAGTAALLVTVLAVLLGYALRLRPTRLVAGAVRFATMGYAVPGAVIAVGVLLPLAGLDRVLASGLRWVAGMDPGLLVTGSAAGLLFAYVVRFLAVGAHAVEAGLSRIPLHLDEAARSLGAGPGKTLRAVHLPLLRGGILTGLALTFVDVMKEMPATILLRPLGWDTLAIAIWQRTAESLWAEAAVPALALVAAGLVPVALILRLDRGPAR
ncbi:MAG TPA: iron ABC transporter permease [Methylomirabilota bacterium]|nr:iron ABC transporter permease [Methylomirabilota bacterium]